ncbi:MAG: helix-turn-helix domain-containing protein [Cyanobacteriota bacterium]|nr:helix-turn-helix domain-containing protein [Cyanobacteriota bacterium]
MAVGRKYQPLFEYLRQKAQSEANRSEVSLSFAQIEILINAALPNSARTRRAWWSNRKTGALQARAWMEAGYEVETVDLAAERVVFRQPRATYKLACKGDTAVWDGETIAGLRRHMGMTQSEFARQLGVRQATVSEWEREVYQVKTSTSKFLSLVAERAGFRYETESRSDSSENLDRS